MVTMFPCTLLALLALLPIIAAALQPICYWPSGTPVEASRNYLPCPRFPNSNSTTVQCCSKGEACLSNGLCYGAQVGMAYRGACTDKSWTDPLCPKSFCAKDFPDRFANIVQCAPKEANGPLQWWCGDQTLSLACEEGGGSFFKWEQAQLALPSTSASSKAASSSPRPSATGVAGNGTGSVRNITLTLVATRTVYSFVHGNTSTVIQTIEASAAPTLASNIADSSQAAASHRTKVATAIGTGIGIPLGLLALAGAGFFLISRHKRKDKTKEKNGGMGWDWYGGRGTLLSGHRPQELQPDSPAPRQEMNTVQTPLDPPTHPPGFKAVIIPPTPSSPENRAPQLPPLLRSPPLEQSPTHPLHPSYQQQSFQPPPPPPAPLIEVSPPLQSPSPSPPLSHSPPPIEVYSPPRSPLRSPTPLASPPAQPILPVLYPSHTEHPPNPFQSPEASQPSPPSPHWAGSPDSVSPASSSEPLQSPKHTPPMPDSGQLPRLYGPPPGTPPPQIYPPPPRP